MLRRRRQTDRATVYGPLTASRLNDPMAESKRVPVAEWTEQCAKRGLEPLGVQTLQHTAVSIPTRPPAASRYGVRDYGVCAWLCGTYARRIRHTDPHGGGPSCAVPRPSTHRWPHAGKFAHGVAGVTWAQRMFDSVAGCRDDLPSTMAGTIGERQKRETG